MKKKTVRHIRHVTHKTSVWKQKVNPFIAWGAIIIVSLIAVFAYHPEFLFPVQGGVEGASTGFNEFGYNYSARIFNAKADGVDKVLDGKVWGDPTYAKDRLVMKWNDEWDRGNTENWSNPPYAAWEDNEWNGKIAGGSGQNWHYKIAWVGSCGADGKSLPNGGYCIWGQFEVVMDQGQDPNSGPGHIWFAHANPTGYGAYKQ